MNKEFLFEMLRTGSVDGNEAELEKKIFDYMQDKADEVTVDEMGNVTAAVNPSSPFKVLLAGHADEIGLMVSAVGEDGSLMVRKIGGVNAKPSRQVKPGDTISVRKGPAVLSYRVIQPLSHRVGAALVPDYAENITPQSELDKFHAPTETFFVVRDKGAGRPTKKDRRTLDAMWDAIGED